MFSPLGCRRGFPREPSPWRAGPPLPCAHGPEDVWDEPPWEHQHRRGRGRWHPPCPRDPRPFPGPANFHGSEKDGRWGPHNCPRLSPWDNGEDDRGPEDCFREGWHPPCPRDPRPFPGPADFHGDEEDRRWAPHDRPLPPPWDNGEDDGGPEDCFREGWHPPCPRDPRPFPGPADFPWDEEDRRWAPHECPPPPPWDDREDNRGPEDCFREGWHPEPPLHGPGCFAWPEFPDEEQHPPWTLASLPGWVPMPRGARWFPEWLPVLGLSWPGWETLPTPSPPRVNRGPAPPVSLALQRARSSSRCVSHSVGNQPSSRSSPSVSGTSRPGVKEVPQHPDPPQPLTSFEGARSKGLPAVSGKVPEPPKPASTPQKSPAADPQAATEAAEPEQAAEATPVKPGARQKPAGSHSQGPSALKTEPALPEESSAGTGEHLEVEPCGQSVPKAGAGGGSDPHGPTAPPEPVERVRTAAGSAGEVGAELCPRSRGRQRLLSGAGEAEAEAACDGLLGGLQPSKNTQVPPGATAEPDARPSQACSDNCATPEASPGTRHPPGSGETEPAAGGQRRLCSTLPTPSPAGTDLRSATVLARKEEIELSYQQFSLTIAVVATMLLQKEPSMEAALGLALRANLRQGRIHHLRELEDFINSYDSATLSR
ncbi:uncharacterized protein LOC142093356 isoform X2 [Calonectris borealis]|uniref:uncharacterized protein LOC142093356 isoform X2 n=1 Tax=Calonectris borealis TaxID=1323832 RepID=UPI003F4B2E10